jgi:hypothetical protein
LMTRWSSALTLTDMPYPFVAVGGACVALAAPDFVCYNAGRVRFNSAAPQ